ncbi:MAG TPA: phosphoglycerate dehydrogenase [Dinghuibacter sp.]|uniref:phosphoglycerate dehydrogenase n=1 Tax=Dinghuibacter sp. TaxID=2024697 RepID=UPI002B7D5C5B|nr:phosphoglycerate dehydrogenase [Dinghuibacter sp.]HTJ10959.1 phosphoglycerate dehydrogenase [Dinghuibacter sp.]
MKVKVSTIAFSKNQYLVGSLLREFPDAVVNTAGVRMNDDAFVDYFSEADAAIIGLELITPAILDRLPNLRMLAKYGVGLDNVDLEACRQRGVTVGWTGGVNKRSVAEMALGFMLALSRNLYVTSNQLKSGTWNKNGGTQLSGKTVGIIGLGYIGKELAGLLRPFGCTILVNDILDVSAYAEAHGLECVSREDLAERADVISIHTPLTKETTNLFDAALLRRMKPTAFLINTARGGIVNEGDLKRALQEGVIAGAALDVYHTEPPVDQELLNLPNLICTPHTGGNSYEAVVAMGVSAIEHLVAYRDKTNNRKEHE